MRPEDKFLTKPWLIVWMRRIMRSMITRKRTNTANVKSFIPWKKTIIKLTTYCSRKPHLLIKTKYRSPKIWWPLTWMIAVFLVGTRLLKQVNTKGVTIICASKIFDGSPHVSVVCTRRANINSIERFVKPKFRDCPKGSGTVGEYRWVS